jgi:hypothetical protein
MKRFSYSPLVKSSVKNCCGLSTWFRLSSFTVDHTFCVRQVGVLEKKMGIQRSITSDTYRTQKNCVVFRRKVLYNTSVEWGILVKLLKLIEMCLNQTYNKFSKAVFDNSLFIMVWSNERLYRHWFSNFSKYTLLSILKQSRRGINWMGHISFWSMLMMLIYLAKMYIVWRKKMHFIRFGIRTSVWHLWTR